MAQVTLEELAKLKEKYEALSRLRETEPEAQNAQLSATLEETQRYSEEILAQLTQLKAENKRLKQFENQSHEFASAVTIAETLHAENTELKKAATPARKAAATGPLAKVVDFYELLTGVTVTLDGERAHCSCGDAQRPLTFEVDLAPEDGEPEVDISFTPTDLSGCSGHLPDYLRESITFERAQAPVLLQKLLKAHQVE